MLNDPNQFTHDAWEANAEVWNARLGDEGNDFFNVLCWPALRFCLGVKPDQYILDIACGNGLTSRRLAAPGAHVTAFDFSANLIEFARSRSKAERAFPPDRPQASPLGWGGRFSEIPPVLFARLWKI
jgi:2-polyprenyl-3-methyl-5-hydroxy-6-metoxy-1,4-benzoquinol methylase